MTRGQQELLCLGATKNPERRGEDETPDPDLDFGNPDPDPVTGGISLSLMNVMQQEAYKYEAQHFAVK